ncbi:transporter [Bacillus weihaiensis]|uniref:transporter n=1 Tax=Bacillus weihaiensis TaxID=1547283 RepID=UPI000A6AC3E2|nr:transporter [Bacillus weihaiensis]
MYPYDRQFSIQIPGFPPFQNSVSAPGQQPPYGPPGFGPGPGGGQQGSPQAGPPQGPPPSEIPPAQSQGQISTYAVDPGGIRGCLYRYTYIRLNNGRAFWYYPTFVGRTSVAGYRWNRRQYRWVYFGIDLERIRSYSCY